AVVPAPPPRPPPRRARHDLPPPHPRRNTMARQLTPLGRVLLVLAGLSLAGYALYHYGVIAKLARVVAPERKAEGTVSKDDFGSTGSTGTASTGNTSTGTTSTGTETGSSSRGSIA